MPPGRVAPWKTWAAVVGLVLWFAVAGLATWVSELNTIECGADPDRCEPAVRLAWHIGLGAQALVFAVALGVLIRAAVRRVLRPAHVVVPVILAVAIVLVTWVASRAAVADQYGLR